MSYFEITTAIILEISGRDAARYLNARLTNDLRSLAENAGCYAAALTPLGKTEGFFQVIKQASSYLLICDGGIKAEVINALMRYKVADQVLLADRSDELMLLHAIALKPELAPLLSLPARRGHTSGFDILLKRAKLSPTISSAAAETQRIVAGIPAFPKEINSEFLFLECNLQDAISHSKGCYVGQEVVERAESQGRLPYKLQHLQFEQTLALTEALTDSAPIFDQHSKDVIGKVISFAHFEDQTYLFARIKNKAGLLPVLSPS